MIAACYKKKSLIRHTTDNTPKRTMIATCYKKKKLNQTYMKYCKLWFRNAL